MKAFYFLFCFIFLTSVVSSVTLSMSPPQIDFIGKTGEKICEKFYIEGDDNYFVIGEDKWAIKGYDERKLSRHKLNSSELDLDVNYLKNFQMKNKTQIEICIEGREEGNYHGILLYKIEDKSIKVGIWMNVSLEKGSSRIVGLTGKIIDEEGEGGGNLLFVLPILLVFILGILIVKGRKKGRGNEFLDKSKP